MVALVKRWVEKLGLRRDWRRWRYVVWHTAAHGNPKTGEVYDTTAAQIDAWHKAQGWRKIGYHFVVRLDGTIEEGRLLNEEGAHVRGLNRSAIGICFSGHGDLQPLTALQMRAGLALTAALCRQWGIPVHRVIGHREVNRLVEAGVLPVEYRVSKTCPGKLVDMREVRVRLQEVLDAISEQGANSQV